LIPATAPKGQGNLGAEGNPQVVQVTTHQRAKFVLDSLPFLLFHFSLMFYFETGLIMGQCSLHHLNGMNF
jgi:hypothetical protein